MNLPSQCFVHLCVRKGVTLGPGGPAQPSQWLWVNGSGVPAAGAALGAHATGEGRTNNGSSQTQKHQKGSLLLPPLPFASPGCEEQILKPFS